MGNPKLYRAFYLKVEVIEDRLLGGEHHQSEFHIYAKCRFVLDLSGNKKLTLVKPFDELSDLSGCYSNVIDCINYHNDMLDYDFDWAVKKPSWDEHLEYDRKMKLKIQNAVKWNHKTPYKERMKQKELLIDFWDFF